MDKVCETKTGCGCEVSVGSSQERRILTVVLLLNAGMFVAEFGAGLVSHSTALLADSLDMLADAFIYGLSLFALRRAAHWRSRAALFNGSLQLVLGLGIAAEAVSKIFLETLPHAPTMGVFGVLALGVNTICFILLSRFRNGEINLRATWICSRNDMLGNIGVLLAAVLVVYFGSAWPDIVIGLLIAGVVVHSAGRIILEAARH